MVTKTDNHNLAAKLALRRELLRRFPEPQGFDVCDAFSGSEALWGRLREEFSVRSYLALDVKAKRGRLKMDSLRYLQNQKWAHNVVDLDAYGSPWRHWFEVLKHGRGCTVFLTIGSTMFQGQQAEALATLGITFDVPVGLHAGLAPLCVDHCLGVALEHGFQIPFAAEADNPGGLARYLGVRLARP